MLRRGAGRGSRTAAFADLNEYKYAIHGTLYHKIRILMYNYNALSSLQLECSAGIYFAVPLALLNTAVQTIPFGMI